MRDLIKTNCCQKVDMNIGKYRGICNSNFLEAFVFNPFKHNTLEINVFVEKLLFYFSKKYVKLSKDKYNKI